MTEVVVTLKGPPLALFGRSLLSTREKDYARTLAAAQARAVRNVRSAIPHAQVRWRYRIVANGFAVALPSSEVRRLGRVPGVAKVWPSFTYHALLNQTPQLIGATKLWGSSFATAGDGVKIGIIDDGVDATHPFFDSGAFSYPPGFPKGQTQFATPKVIVQRVFPAPEAKSKYAGQPFDPDNSFHGTHVAGIAAGDHGVADGVLSLSGVAPNAYIGNYRALTVVTPTFGLDGNSPEIAAAIEAAVADGMDVINLSLGEPEIEPSRDIVVHAMNAAAAAGVVPVVAAGNDFTDYGYGSVGSPGTAAGAITVGAATKTATIATFSSAGPTPVSFQFKPDVSAPGVGITSSLPADQGGLWGQLQGTSMASPHVAGGAALLKERHPGWTVAQIKSALVQTGDPVHSFGGGETEALRQGGGLINLQRADNPLLFAAPTALSFPINGGTRAVELSDAGGGEGTWSVAVKTQNTLGGVNLAAPATATVPGRLTVTANVASGARSGDVSGFVVLSRGDDTRRIPFWLAVSRPVLGTEAYSLLERPGVYRGTTAAGMAKISRYRYPTGGDEPYRGPEVVYRVKITKPVANFGAAVLSGQAVPHVTYAGDEDHLVGYPGLPQAINPYFSGFGERRPIAGAVLPLPGTYDIVFDSRSRAEAGAFTFRFWVGDTRPPRLRVVSADAGRIVVSATDAGAGVDPESVTATLDGSTAQHQYSKGRIVIRASRGKHLLVLRVSDYQEAKNMEDVPAVRPNTAVLTTTVNLRHAGSLTAGRRR
jgi:subtilisin family serine protease